MTVRAALMMLSLCLLATPSPADTAIWVNFGAVSHHVTNRQLNNINTGFGLEVPAHGFLIMGGIYRNSLGSTSKYLTAEKCMVSHGRACLGAMAGFVDGYRLNDGGFIPVVAPTLTINGDRIGARLMFTPQIDDRIAATLSLQLRLRIK